MPVMRPTIPAVLRPDPWPVQFVDDFNGTEALSAHVPDFNRAAPYAPYSIKYGTFNTLSGGEARYTSGVFGCAVVDCGLSDVAVTARIKCRSDFGVILRSNADGTNRWQWHLDGNGNPGVISLLKFTALNVESYMYQWGPVYWVPDEYHEVTIVAYLGYWRAFWDGVNLGGGDTFNETYMNNTYVGLGTFQGYNTFRWDRLEVRAVDTSKLMRMGLIGDSISNERGEWGGIAASKYFNGCCYLRDLQAQSGAQIKFNMDTYVANLAGAEDDLICILLGTNDGGSYNPYDEYLENLLELGASNPGARIYGMGILEATGWSEGDRNLFNSRIEAACLAAKAAGVCVEYVNTDDWIDPTRPTWQALTEYALDAVCTPTGSSGYQYRATVGGTSGETQPTWPGTVGQTVVDGTVTWVCEYTTFDTSDGLHPSSVGQNKIANAILARFP